VTCLFFGEPKIIQNCEIQKKSLLKNSVFWFSLVFPLSMRNERKLKNSRKYSHHQYRKKFILIYRKKIILKRY
jgi:hypothetical protein